MILAEKIKHLRKLRKMTMKELGMRLGFDEKTASIRIAHWENGSRNPRPETIEEMATILDVAPQRLSGGSVNIIDIVIDHLLWTEDGSQRNYADAIRLAEFLSMFWRKTLQLQNGEISQEDLIEWKLHWPDA